MTESKLLLRCMGNAAHILYRDVMETDSLNFTDMCDKIAIDTIIRCAERLKVIDPEAYERNKTWIEHSSRGNG